MRSKISPLFHFGINLLICCICIAQNKADSAPTSVLDGLRDGHGNILYVEDAIHQVGKKLLLPKLWQDLVDKVEEGRTNLGEETDGFASAEDVQVRSKRSPLPKKKKGNKKDKKKKNKKNKKDKKKKCKKNKKKCKKNEDDEEDDDDDNVITTTTQDPEDEQSSTTSTTTTTTTTSSSTTTTTTTSSTTATTQTTTTTTTTTTSTIFSEF